jgi:hypothetical protein
MECPQCHRGTPRIIVGFRRDLTKVEGCPHCYKGTGEVDRDANLYTGRKIWTGNDAYGKKRCREMNHNWVDRMADRAAERARTRSPLRPGGHYSGRAS